MAYDVNNDPVHNGNSVKRLHESLSSLNIGFAITYALFTYDGTSYIAMHAIGPGRNGLAHEKHYR